MSDKRVLLIAGGIHQIISSYKIKKIHIVNDKQLYLQDMESFLHDINPVLEAVLVTDEAFCGHVANDKQNLLLLLQWINKEYRSDIKVLVLTKDFMLESNFEDLYNKYGNLSFLTCDFIRVPKYMFNKAFEELLAESKQLNQNSSKHDKSVEVEKKKSFFDRFKYKSKDESGLRETDYLTKELEKISRGISRIVAVTGHRGSGLTSTAVNVACEANKRGLSAIIVDMDIDYRSTNMYFSSFHERTKNDDDINASLIRTLARPQDYMTTAFNLKDKLWLTSLGYQFKDRKLIDQFYNNSKLVGLLSVLRNKFNLVILDIPMDLFKIFKDTLIHIDVFALCVPNSIHGVLSTLRNVEVVLDSENTAYVNSKSRVIVTKYNDRSRFQNEIFIPDKVNELLSSGLSQSFVYEMKLAGYVPYSNEFDSQIETDVPLVNTSVEHEKAYGNILLRLMEGAK